MGPGVAQEFGRTKEGPTIWEDHFLPEVVDPRSGRGAGEGEPGELVFTSLTKEAMPIVRYRTRDLTRLLPGNVTAMRRFAKITGRTDDMLIIRGVNVFPSQVEELILDRRHLRRTTKSTSRDRTGWTRWWCGSRRGRICRPKRIGPSRSRSVKNSSRWSEFPRRFVVASASLQRSGGKAVRVTDRR